jgi:hypothetical protein
LDIGNSADSTALAVSSLVKFEVSRGRHAQTGRGALIGAGIGAVLGLFLGIVTYEACSGFCPAPDPGPGVPRSS